MYTDPTNVAKSMLKLLDKYQEILDNIIQEYYSQKSLTILFGERRTLPADAYPCLVVEPSDTQTEWATTRGQRPRISFNCRVYAMCDNEDAAVEFLTTLTTCIVGILTSPQNLNLKIHDTSKWSLELGLSDMIAIDSFIDSVSWNAVKEGMLRAADFTWWVQVHETYPDSYFRIGQAEIPNIEHPEPKSVPEK